MKTVKYYTKNVYGKELIYLSETADASVWKTMTGATTITKGQMESLRLLTGVQFERVFEPALV